MPTEPRCSICTTPATKVAVSGLLDQGLSQRAIASRLKIPRSNLQRHFAHAEKRTGSSAKKPAQAQARSSSGKLAHAGRRSRDGRCDKCGIDPRKTTPEDLLARAERLMFFGETIVTKAQDAEDYRLMLTALDKTRQSLELVMRAHGMLVPDAGSTTIVDQRRQVFNVLASLSEEELRARLTGKPIGALPLTIDAAETKALPASIVSGNAPIGFRLTVCAKLFE